MFRAQNKEIQIRKDRRRGLCFNFQRRVGIVIVFRRLRTGLLRFFFGLIGLLLDKVFRWIYKKDYHRPLPPIKNPILMETAENLALKIRTKELRSEEVIESFISRIREVNPIINAVVDERFGAALEEARAADRLVASGRKTPEELVAETPLLGVPFTIKDSFKVKGLRNTSGHVRRKRVLPSDDADVVELMRKAGAIPLAVTNVPELCMWWETSNNIYGRTNNPYDNSRNVGGSSGGEAAIVSAAGSVIGIGTDIVCSIRVPVFNNGIFGHKPSRGIVSNEGQFPKNEGKISEYNTTGPICRYASDLSLVYQVLAGSNAKLLKLDQEVNFKKLKFFYMEDDGGSVWCSRVHPEIREAMKKVVAHLDKEFGIKAYKIKLDNLRYSCPIMFTKFFTGSKYRWCEALGMGKKPVKPIWETLKWILGLSIHTLPAIALGLMERFFKKDGKLDKRCDIWIQDLHCELKEYLGDNGVFLYPTQPTPALYHNQTVVTPFNVAYCSIFNNLGLPSTACPLGLSKAEGLPLGIQVVSWHANDHLSLAVARELEKAFGGWVSPSQVDL